MSNDLVKRLRQWDCGESTWGLLESAADRIEKLEAALLEIAYGPRDVDKSCLSLFHEIQSEARATLGDKTDEN